MTILKIIYLASIVYFWVGAFRCCFYVRRKANIPFRKFLNSGTLEALIIAIPTSLIPILNISSGSMLFNDDMIEKLWEQKKKKGDA
jgi:hypothetical protein